MNDDANLWAPPAPGSVADERRRAESTRNLPAVPGTIPIDPTKPPRQLIDRIPIVGRTVAWARRPWDVERIVRVIATAASLIVTTWVMMNVIHFNPFEWTGFGHEDLIFDDTTPAGGDLGAHVWAPAYLRDELLPNWQLSGWTMDWYEGMPLYRFYMVVPALAIVALDVALPYGIAMKVVAMSGMLTLPACCWAFGRLAKFRFPVPELFAFAGLCFVLNESYYLFGGNVRSTMAGEFSFSVAMSLMMLGLGFLARALDDGSRRITAAVFLALACLSHGIVLIYTAITAIVFVACKVIASDRVHVWRAAIVGALTLALSAFWVGPFLTGHQYMTDMKYGYRPDSRIYPDDSYWDLLFDQKLPLDLVINGLAIVGFAFAIARRHRYGIGLGITTIVAMVFVYLAHDSLPVIGLLWNPRVLPFVYMMRYLLMMVGAAYLVGAIAAAARHRATRDPASLAAPDDDVVDTADDHVTGRAFGGLRTGSGVATLLAGGLTVLIIFGWVFQVLPGGRWDGAGDNRVYAWGPVAAPVGQSTDALGDKWTDYNFNGYERRPTYGEYHALMQTMADIGAEHGCGRALWERDQRENGNKRYGSSMALMLLPFWTDGCITSSEGLYFEASGTTPYHFLTTAALSENASPPVRQMRVVNNDAEVGVGYARTLGIRYVMLTRPDAIAEADKRPELTQIATSGPWTIYRLSDPDVDAGRTDSELVVPLDVQPIVINERAGDQRECWLEVGTSWFQRRDTWPALPAENGPDDWERLNVAIIEAEQVPPEQPNDGCGDPQYSLSRDVNVVGLARQPEIVELPEITVSDVEIGNQTVSFEVSEPGVPVLVRVSYFPNWTARGAEGPYRVAPNFMVVVPTETRVELSYHRTTLDIAFEATTAFGLVAAAGLYLGTRRGWRWATPGEQRHTNDD